jgi:LPXTG-motif cell wall-anchored protein
MTRSSLAKAESPGSGGGETALYAGVGVGLFAALAVLWVARRKKMT